MQKYIATLLTKYKYALLLAMYTGLFLVGLVTMLPAKAEAADYNYIDVGQAGWNYYVEGTDRSNASRIIATKGETIVIFKYAITKNGDTKEFRQTRDYYSQSSDTKECYAWLDYNVNNGDDKVYIPYSGADCTRGPVNDLDPKIAINAPPSVIEAASLINWGNQPRGCPGFDPLPNSNTRLSANYNCPDGGSVQDGVYKSAAIEPENPISNEGELTISEGCARAVPGVGWLFCSIIDLADGVYGFFQSRVQELLLIDESSFDNQQLYESWSNVRNIANALVVLSSLIIIASQIFGFEILSAYAVKKALPRVLIAVIAIQLSWIGLTSLIALTNAVGVGIHDLLIYPFASQGSDDITSLYANSSVASGLSVSLLALGGIGLGGAALFAAGGGVFALLLTLLSVLVSILVAMFVLLVRSLLIIILLVLSPIAIAAWVIPGTQNWFNIWWQLFSKLLLMLPLIMVLFAAGTIGANILFFSNSTNAGFSDLFTTISMLVVYFAPLFLITATFKFAGGLFNKITSIGDRAKGAGDKFGWFGARDKANITKENRAWNRSKSQQNEAMKRKGQKDYAERLTRASPTGARGFYNRRIQKRTGIDDTSRKAAEAYAAQEISKTVEEENQAEASLTRFYTFNAAQKGSGAWQQVGMSEKDWNDKTDYEREEKIRSAVLAAYNQGAESLDIGGQSIKLRDTNGAATSMVTRTALSALANKDGSNNGKDPLSKFLETEEGYKAMNDLGNKDGKAFGTMSERAPSIGKGDGNMLGGKKIAGGNRAGEIDFSQRGFDDAVNGYGNLPARQRQQVTDAFKEALQNGDETSVKNVLARLDTIAKRSNASDAQLSTMTDDLDKILGPDINLGALRADREAQITTVTDNQGNRTFQIAKGAGGGGQQPPQAGGGGQQPPQAGGGGQQPPAGPTIWTPGNP